MASQLIAVGTTLAVSADIVVADGESVSISLRNAADRARCYIQLKDEASGYHTVDTLTDLSPQASIASPGTYRCKRPLGSSCGVFRG